MIIRDFFLIQYFLNELAQLDDYKVNFEISM